MSEKLSKDAEKMVTNEHIADAMHGYVVEAAEPAVPGESRKSMLHRAARALGLNPRRAYAFFYKEARAVTAEELLNTQQKIISRRKRQAAAMRRKLKHLDRMEREYAIGRAAHLQNHPQDAESLAPADFEAPYLLATLANEEEG